MSKREVNKLRVEGREMLRRRLTTLSPMAAVAAALAIAPQAAWAQEAAKAEDAGVSEITVTARKREEAIQSVPASIQVLGGSDLEELGKVTFKDLQFETPGLYMEN